MKYMRSMSLKNKITLTVFTLLLGIFLICSLALNTAFKLYNRTIYESKAGEIGANMQRIEEEFRTVEALSEEYMTQQSMQKNLEIWANTNDRYERSTAEGELNEYLMNLATRKRYIKGVILENESGKAIKWERDYIIPQREYDRLFNTNIPDNGSNYWIEPEDGNDLFTSVRAVRRVGDRSFETIGKLYIIVDMKSMTSAVCNNSFGEDMSLFIYGNEKIYGTDDFSSSGIVETFLEEDKNYNIKSTGSMKYFLVRVSGQLTRYRYVAVMNLDTLFSNIARFNFVVIACFIFIFILLVILTNYVSRKLLRRLEILCDNMKEMEKGNLSVKSSVNIPNDSRDEIDILTRRFYSMADEIDSLVNDNYKKALLFRETQLKLLHSQIKPHFLYNTLETINWMAISKGQNEISAIVKALGNLLRNSIGKNQHIVTVEEELRLLNDYLLIQKNRFGEALEVSFNIEKDMYRYSILKMSLQIPVENSIKHVLEKTGGICKINISIEKTGEELLICVSDNGSGIPDSIISSIKNGEYETNSGIGLENIEKRIRLIYGESYGLEICNKEEGGASVTMRIPAKTVNRIEKAT